MQNDQLVSCWPADRLYLKENLDSEKKWETCYILCIKMKQVASAQ